MTWRIAIAALAAGATLLTIAERRWPLRRAADPGPRRFRTNLATGAITAVAMQGVLLPVILGVAAAVEARGWGLLGALADVVPLPPAVRLAAALVLLDYTFYWWHRLAHVVPALWRFHVVHHTDLDLDVTTAVRFHVGEYALGSGFRVLQILAIGAGPLAALLFEGLVVAAAVFHHSNVRLPLALERGLVRLLVTPRMHSIHHSTVERETSSNWSTVLPMWDWLHGTRRLDVPHSTVVIGLPAYRDAQQLGLATLLALPFRRQPSAWEPRPAPPAPGTMSARLTG
jgi:sterol desaturase/sphingolipid hydroxylase (fatty acid hydroxylase superfamily)